MAERLLRSRLLWWLVAANAVAFALVAWFTWLRVAPNEIRIRTIAFDALPGWSAGDPRPALAAFGRSCARLASRPAASPLGGLGYAGVVRDWLPVCRALPRRAASAAAARAYFEQWFAPLAVETAKDGLFTGYYEPELAVRWRPAGRFRVPIYGRPSDLVTADLGRFRAALAGQHVAGRLQGAVLVPYPTRAEIDASPPPTAPVLLYTDDAIGAFFLAIQGSGRARFADGETLRLAFDGTNGRPYTAIGRVLVAKGALAKAALSLQAIRAWLTTHPAEARAVMETDQSFVFFALSAVGDPALGSPGTEGVPLTPQASLAIDPRIHPLGVPVYVASTAPAPAQPDRVFDRLLVAQDTGGAITGAVRGDVFFGFGPAAENAAGRMKSPGRLFVLVPKAVAAALAPSKSYAEATP